MFHAYRYLRNWLNHRRLFRYEAGSSLTVSPLEKDKHQTLLSYAQKYHLTIFVETGTYLGNTIEALKNHFDQIFSIELDKRLFNFAQKRFNHDSNVTIIYGDSGRELGKIIKRINQPILFWLDGHYSMGITAKGEKDTPILKEVNHILNRNNPKDVILIDDARCFGSLPDYPTIQELKEVLTTKRKDADFTVERDIIRITPKEI